MGLNVNLNRFNLSDTMYCACGEVEDVSHFLLHCPNYELQRRLLVSELGDLGVDPTEKNILGGGNFPSAKQNTIVECISKYLLSSGRINEL